MCSFLARMEAEGRLARMTADVDQEAEAFLPSTKEKKARSRKSRSRRGNKPRMERPEGDADDEVSDGDAHLDAEARDLAEKFRMLKETNPALAELIADRPMASAQLSLQKLGALDAMPEETQEEKEAREDAQMLLKTVGIDFKFIGRSKCGMEFPELDRKYQAQRDAYERQLSSMGGCPVFRHVSPPQHSGDADADAAPHANKKGVCPFTGLGGDDKDDASDVADVSAISLQMKDAAAEVPGNPAEVCASMAGSDANAMAANGGACLRNDPRVTGICPVSGKAAPGVIPASKAGVCPFSGATSTDPAVVKPDVCPVSGKAAPGPVPASEPGVCPFRGATTSTQVSAAKSGGCPVSGSTVPVAPSGVCPITGAGAGVSKGGCPVGIGGGGKVVSSSSGRGCVVTEEDGLSAKLYVPGLVDPVEMRSLPDKVTSADFLRVVTAALKMYGVPLPRDREHFWHTLVVRRATDELPIGPKETIQVAPAGEVFVLEPEVVSVRVHIPCLRARKHVVCQGMPKKFRLKDVKFAALSFLNLAAYENKETETVLMTRNGSVVPLDDEMSLYRLNLRPGEYLVWDLSKEWARTIREDKRREEEAQERWFSVLTFGMWGLIALLILAVVGAVLVYRKRQADLELEFAALMMNRNLNYDYHARDPFSST